MTFAGASGAILAALVVFASPVLAQDSPGVPEESTGPVTVAPPAGDAAESPQPEIKYTDETRRYIDFTFKRVKPPAADAPRRITVQITGPSPRLLPPPKPDPNAPRPPAPDDTAIAGAGVGGGGSADWYWQKISPLLTRASPGRLDEALLALRDAPPGEGFVPPRLDALRAIADRHGIEILSATVGTRVSPALVLAVIAVESSGQIQAVSPAGARGLMQLMPATAARFGVSNSFRSDENIRGGVAYLDFLLNEFSLDPVLALAGYNAGEGAVRSNGGVPPYNETRAYVPKVLAAWQVAKGLCLTPPTLVTDGCVFVRGSG